MRVIVTRDHRYGGRARIVGQEYDMPDRDAKVLQVAKRVRPAPAAAAQSYMRRDMQAAVPAMTVDDLRNAYQTKAGKPADKRWGEARLKRELSA